MAIARTRKRCFGCSKMIEAGEEVTITDDRYQQTGAGKTPWIGNRQTYTRGAVHLWHPACKTAFDQAVKESDERAKREHDERCAEIKAAIARLEEAK